MLSFQSSPYLRIVLVEIKLNIISLYMNYFALWISNDIYYKETQANIYMQSYAGHEDYIQFKVASFSVMQLAKSCGQNGCKKSQTHKSAVILTLHIGRNLWVRYTLGSERW